MTVPVILEECVYVLNAIRGQCFEGLCWNTGLTGRLILLVKNKLGKLGRPKMILLYVLGHSAKISFYSGILYAKFFDCGVSLYGAGMILRIFRKCQVVLPERPSTL
jgi:hypothetical protein